MKLAIDMEEREARKKTHCEGESGRGEPGHGRPTPISASGLDRRKTSDNARKVNVSHD